MQVWSLFWSSAHRPGSVQTPKKRAKNALPVTFSRCVFQRNPNKSEIGLSGVTSSPSWFLMPVRLSPAYSMQMVMCFMVGPFGAWWVKGFCVRARRGWRRGRWPGPGRLARRRAGRWLPRLAGRGRPPGRRRRGSAGGRGWGASAGLFVAAQDDVAGQGHEVAVVLAAAAVALDQFDGHAALVGGQAHEHLAQAQRRAAVVEVGDELAEGAVVQDGVAVALEWALPGLGGVGLGSGAGRLQFVEGLAGAVLSGLVSVEGFRGVADERVVGGEVSAVHRRQHLAGGADQVLGVGIDDGDGGAHDALPGMSAEAAALASAQS